ncbi:hypothetical protein Dip518_001247 [Parelusimicrobium proximum]|uniref:hypothetical protein n=1 Tax=Parelusimicrobium proximum TaxID=3228953 RepID=UPI003D185210
MNTNNIPKDLPLSEYTLKWKERNSLLLKEAISKSKDILKNLRKYKNYEALLVGNFLENFTITAEAILLLAFKYFEGEIIVLAGTMIEGFCLMQYCLKNNKTEEYFDYLVLHSLMMEYKTSEVASDPKDLRKVPQIESDIKILKELKDKYLKSNKDYSEVIAFIESEKNSPASKRKMINDSYKKFSKRSIESMVNEFVDQGLMKVSYEKYCNIKHHHINNSFVDPKTKFVIKEFNPFDELTAISSALVILDKLLLMYAEMKERGDIEEKSTQSPSV